MRMALTHWHRVLSLGSLFAIACGGQQVVEPPVGQARQATYPYNTRPNGTGIHIGSTQPESWIGLTNTSANWFLNGFSKRSDGSWWATGYYSLDVGLKSADARVMSVQSNGTTYQLRALHTTGSQLTIELTGLLGNVRTLQGSDVVGTVLNLRLPDATGVLNTNYRLKITSSDSVESRFNDVIGYQIQYQQDGLLDGAAWSSYCKGPSGESQFSVFYEGATWSPLDGARTQGANLITMTCETGSVATCMRWGYSPWNSAQGSQSATAYDYHQACIHMKRASYCGDSRAHTVDGTRIIVSDTQDPPLNSGPLDTIEALWTPEGATCLSNPRHPEIPFLGCPLPLPTCPAQPSGGYLIANGLPSAGSLLGLLD